MVVFEDGLAAQVRVPPVRDPRTSTGRTTRRVDPRGDHAAGSGATSRSASSSRASEADDRAEPTTARPTVPTGRPIDPETGRPRKFAYPPQPGRRRRRARRRSPRPQRALDELGIDDVALCGLAKRLEEVWLPGRRRPGDPAAHQRGALPAAAGPRRGAPVRDHLPPAEAVQGDDDQRPGRRPGARARPGARRCCKHFGSLKRLPRGQRGGDHGGAGHRAAHRRGRGRRRSPAHAPRRPAVNIATGEILDDAADTGTGPAGDR